MTKRERETLEADAANVRPEIAFKLGKIVVIDEILSIMDDAVQNDQGISGKALSIAIHLMPGRTPVRIRVSVPVAKDGKQ